MTDLAQDAAGNTYVTGHFAGTMTIGSTTLTSNGVKQDLFVAKLGPAGDLVWAKGFGGTGIEYGFGIDVGNDGSVYVTGSFHDAITFTTASGPINLTSAGGSDLLVIKLDANGSVYWARRGGSGSVSDSDAGLGIALDSSGNAYVSAHFQGTADFGSTTLTSIGGIGDKDQVLIKMNSAGDFVWVQQLGGPGDETASDVVIDASDHIFVGGSVLARYDSAGSLLWSQGPGGGPAVYQNGTTGEVYLYSAENSSELNADIVVVRRLNADTGENVWQKSISAPVDVVLFGFAADAAGNLYLTGGWGFSSGSAAYDLDPGPGTFYLENQNPIANGYNSFLLKLNSAGDFLSARRVVGGTGSYQLAHDVEVDAVGNVFMCGEWGATGEFDVGDSTVVRTSPYGEGQGFVLKMTQGLGAISGRVFADADGNGTQGTDEPPVAGTTVYLDQNGNGSPDSGEASVTSGVAGVYTFSHLPAGTYTVRQVVRTGWTGSAPAGGTHIVTLAADQFVGGRDFGQNSSPTTTTYTKNTSLSIRDIQKVTSTIVVSGGTSFIYDADVRINITHANDADLDVFLIAPDGTRVELTTDNGGTGDHYANTIFDDEAATSITAGAAPFSARYRPEGMLSVLDGKIANGTWALEVTDDTRKNTGTLLSWSLTVKGASTVSGLLSEQAASNPAPADGSADALAPEPVQLVLAEVAARWAAAGEDAANLGNVTVQIVDLADGYLGLASGNTIWLDDNAAGWGWFVDSTPGDPSEFALPGNQGEQDRMDLLTVLMHELGHLLGHVHDQDGVMAETLAAGVRRIDLGHEDAVSVDHVLGQWNDPRTTGGWLGISLSDPFESTHLRAKKRR